MSSARRLLAGLTPRYAFLKLDNYSTRLSVLSRFCLPCRTFAQNARPYSGALTRRFVLVLPTSPRRLKLREATSGGRKRFDVLLGRALRRKKGSRQDTEKENLAELLK
jgi:hypothetical protein